MVSGHCNCGAVRYEAEVDVSDVYVCHCSICRRFTGAGSIAVVVVPRSAFRWLSGSAEISRWKKPGADWEACFCRCCGSAIPGDNDASTVYLPAGSISTGGERLRVAHHLYVDSKAVWEQIGDEGTQHAEVLRR